MAIAEQSLGIIGQCIGQAIDVFRSSGLVFGLQSQMPIATLSLFRFEGLGPKLWVISQMAAARMERTVVDIGSADGQIGLLHAVELFGAAVDVHQRLRQTRWGQQAVTTGGHLAQAHDQTTLFAQRKEKTITALPINIPHPERALAILRRVDAPRSPAVEQFSAFIRSGFDNLKHLIKRHEEAVVWGS